MYHEPSGGNALRLLGPYPVVTEEKFYKRNSMGLITQHKAVCCM
jgi:hypothetical protein